MNVRLIGWCARSLSAPQNSSVRTEYALVLAHTFEGMALERRGKVAWVLEI